MGGCGVDGVGGVCVVGARQGGGCKGGGEMIGGRGRGSVIFKKSGVGCVGRAGGWVVCGTRVGVVCGLVVVGCGW